MREILSQAVQARRAGRLDEAKMHLTAALEAAGEDRLARALVLRELGEMARHTSQKAEAVAYYQQAVALLREAGAPPTLLAHTVRHLGDVYMEANQPEQAEPCLREAVALYASRSESGPLDVANALRSLADYCESTGAEEEARQLWSDVRARYAELGVEAGVQESNRRLRRLDGLR